MSRASRYHRLCQWNMDQLNMADSRPAPSQWETSLQSNAVSHWLGANLESALVKPEWRALMAWCLIDTNASVTTSNIHCMKGCSEMCRNLGSTAAEAPVKFLSDLIILKYQPNISSVGSYGRAFLMVLRRIPDYHNDVINGKFSALLALCADNLPVTGEFPAQRPVTRSSDVFFDLSLNERLSKQCSGWWFETLSRPLWRHCNVFASLWQKR